MITELKRRDDGRQPTATTVCGLHLTAFVVELRKLQGVD